MSARLIPNLQPRWGNLSIEALDSLERLHLNKRFTLQSTNGLQATANLAGYPDVLVHELIAHARWAILARAWADAHPRRDAGTAIRAADALILGMTPAERRS